MQRVILATHPPTHAQQHSSTAVVEYVHARFDAVSHWDFHVFVIPRGLGDRSNHPRESTFPRPPLSEFGVGTSSLAGDTH